MAKQVRASEEVNNLIVKAQAEVDQIKAKWVTAEPTPEEVTKLNELVSQLEALATEQQLATANERLAKFKETQEAPQTPAPQFKLPAQAKKAVTASEVFHALLTNGFREPVNADTQYRMAKAGLHLGTSISIPTDFSLLNAKKRKQYRTLSKGADPGQDLIFQNYSDDVIDIMAYTSPLLSVLNIESVPNGNVASYFSLDDSANESTDITASAGSELVPTIPNKDVSDAVIKCGMFTITSGYQKVTRQELTDSYIGLDSKFSEFSGARHALKMERDIITATGNGETGRKGLLTAATSASNITGGAWTWTGLQSFYFGFDIRYRNDLVWVVSPATYGDLHTDLLDQNDRSYFDVNVVDGQEYETLFGKRVFVSSYMDDDVVLGFNPRYFIVRTKNTQSFDVLREAYFPHLAYVGLMDFGCTTRFPTGSCKKVTLTS